jgi:hypothetical protein
MQSCPILLLRWCVYLTKLFSFQCIPLTSDLVSLSNDVSFQIVYYQWSALVPGLYFPTQPLCHYHPLFFVSPFLELFMLLLPFYPSSFCCILPLEILTGWEDLCSDTAVRSLIGSTLEPSKLCVFWLKCFVKQFAGFVFLSCVGVDL